MYVVVRRGMKRLYFRLLDKLPAFRRVRSQFSLDSIVEERSFRKSLFFSHAKASAGLGFAPETDFAAGVAATAKWYRETGYL